MDELTDKQKDQLTRAITECKAISASVKPFQAGEIASVPSRPRIAYKSALPMHLVTLKQRQAIDEQVEHPCADCENTSVEYCEESCGHYVKYFDGPYVDQLEEPNETN